MFSIFDSCHEKHTVTSWDTLPSHVKRLLSKSALASKGANGSDYTSSAEVSRPLIGTPGIPADRLRALREAFMAATRDPELLAEIKKSQIDFDPAPGEYLQQLAERVAKTPRDIVQRASAALQVK